jgi:rare lipoprotein A (peptidoglycan hydrolase)
MILPEGIGDIARLIVALLAIAALFALLNCLFGPAHADPFAASVWVGGRQMRAAHKESCIASIYDQRSGTRTASGRRLDVAKLTAAHKSLRLGSLAKVCRIERRARGLEGGTREPRCVKVQITDRGPYVRRRCIDLTPAAAAAIGLTRRAGLAAVTVEAVR